MTAVWTPGVRSFSLFVLTFCVILLFFATLSTASEMIYRDLLIRIRCAAVIDFGFTWYFNEGFAQRGS